MRALIIGGRKFVGPALVEACRARDIEVTLFCRGQTNPELYPELEVVLGDRRTDIGRLGDRRFDLVLDTCGYQPEDVALSVDHLAERAGFYAFISTGSVYADLSADNVDEDHATAAVDESLGRDAAENYGPLKVLCEKEVDRAFADRALIVRAGLIAGHLDPTDRFTYWPVRLARGGRVLAPGDGSDPIQVIDVADLAAFAVDLAAGSRGGIFNTTGPAEPTTIADLIAACPAADGTELEWVASDFLSDNEVAPWKDLPAWLPSEHPARGMMRVDISRALAAGLTLRPLSETARATLIWRRTVEERIELKAGLTPVRESELLARWARSRG